MEDDVPLTEEQKAQAAALEFAPYSNKPSGRPTHRIVDSVVVPEAPAEGTREDGGA